MKSLYLRAFPDNAESRDESDEMNISISSEIRIRRSSNLILAPSTLYKNIKFSINSENSAKNEIIFFEVRVSTYQESLHLSLN